MAAILELVFKNEISSLDILVWLSDDNQEKVHSKLIDLTNIKQDFVPFFLNYLRDQTAHLIQSGRNAVPSPVKTPTLLAKKTFSENNNKENRKDGSRRRVQLFSLKDSLNTDIDSSMEKYDDSLQFENNKSQSRNNDSFLSANNSFTMSENSSFEMSPSHNTGRRRKKHSADNSLVNGSNRSINRYSTPDQQRSKHKHCLGEFFISPEFDQRKKKGKGATKSPPPVFTKSDTHTELKTADITSGFSMLSLNNIDEFPPVGKPLTPHNSKPEKRKITPTTIVSNHGETTNPVVSNIGGTPTPLVSNTGGRRRITPTTVVMTTAPTAFSSVKSVSFEETKSAFQSASEGSLEQDWKMLRQQKAELLTSDRPESPPIPSTPNKVKLERSASLSEIMLANSPDVTHKDKLNVLAELYSDIIDENLVTNLTLEVYFLMQLLTVRGVDIESITENDDDEVNVLESIHNAVHFAVLVLNKQDRLLRLLDRGALKLLLDNPRIQGFSVELLEKISHKYEEAVPKLVSFPSSFSTQITCVSFQADTDNRKNFPSEKSFHQFKKQRDQFYELIREWEEYHETSGWSVLEVQTARIKNLIHSKMELATCMHFARLFQGQLIAMCKGDRHLQKDKADYESVSFLKQLRRFNPEKFKRLQERFVTPSSMGGPVPSPTFPGYQEFFRDFIVAASNTMFNQHLIDVLTAKILELNKVTVSLIMECGDETSNSEKEPKDIYMQNIMVLQLLAKFAGFLVFLPYQSTEKLPASLQEDYILIRNKSSPAIDILECIQNSRQGAHMVLSIPWIVHYLAMMDSTAPTLDYYKNTFTVLLKIHMYIGMVLKERFSYNYLVVLLVLGWFFQNPIFPEEIFFTQKQTNSSSTVCHIETGLDFMNIVDQSMLHSCCPFLTEVKTLLLDFAVGINNKNSCIRKITPVSRERPSSPPFGQKKIELLLEENFFHNHPASMKRTVEFVADRVASNYIKKFRAHSLGACLEEARKALSGAVLDLSFDSFDGSPTTKQNDKIWKKLKVIADQHSGDSRLKGCNNSLSYCEANCKTTLPLLLPEEINQQIVIIATGICQRFAKEKVSQWMSTYITPAIFHRELQSDLEKHYKHITYSRSSSPLRKMPDDQDEGVKPLAAEIHDAMAPIPSNMLSRVKITVEELLIDQIVPSVAQLDVLLSDIDAVLHKRQDTLSSVLKALGCMILELHVLLATSDANLYQSIKSQFKKIWTSKLKDATDFSSCLSVQNIIRVRKTRSWEIFSEILYDFILSASSPLELFSSLSIGTIVSVSDKVTKELFACCLCNTIDLYFKMNTTIQTNSKDCIFELLDALHDECGSNCDMAKKIQNTHKIIEDTCISIQN